MLRSASESAPSLRLLVGEGRVLRDWARARLRPRASERPNVGRGAVIMTLPGFCANDMSMAQMRHNLTAAGFRAHGWGLGSNTGASIDLFDRIDDRLANLVDRYRRPVHLVGWSLGGLMAREYAKARPGNVASVTTMGSPFSGSLKANNAWRLYQWVAGHKIEEPPVPFDPAPRPPVPTYALWSAKDGVIASACARGEPHESDRAIELDCGHFGFAFADESIDTVIACAIDAEARNRAAR